MECDATTDAATQRCPFINKLEMPRQTEQSLKLKLARQLVVKIRENLLLLLTLCGVFVGFGLGFGLRRYELSDSGLMWLAYPRILRIMVRGKAGTPNMINSRENGDPISRAKNTWTVTENDTVRRPGDDVDGRITYDAASQTRVDNSNPERKKTNRILSIFKENALLFFTLCGVILGFGLGFGLRQYELTGSGLMWLGLPGEIFMRMLTLTILPLIVASIISGTASLDPKSNGKISMVAILYVVSSNAVGVFVGLIMYFIIKPDKYVDVDKHTKDAIEKTTKLETQDIFADLIRNLFPNNIVTACFEKTQTKYDVIEKVQLINGTNITIEDYTRVISTSSGTNVLGLIIICSIIGIATGKLGEAGTPFVLFFKAFSDIIIMVLRWFIWFTPVGVASLIASSVAKADNLESTFVSLAMFVLMLTLAVLFIILILVPGLFFIITRKNPFVFLYTAIRPMMSGFAPPSSAIAIPDVLVSAETKNGVDIRISRFSVPFGAALCRCGSGAFMITVSLFLAALEGVSLHPGQIVYVTILAIVSTLAIPAVPSSSVICVIIILSSVNIHSTNIGIIMSLEWLQDRLRTTSNVMSNLFGAVLINKVCRNSLTDLEKPKDDVTLNFNSLTETYDERL